MLVLLCFSSEVKVSSKLMHMAFYSWYTDSDTLTFWIYLIRKYLLFHCCSMKNNGKYLRNILPKNLWNTLSSYILQPIYYGWTETFVVVCMSLLASSSVVCCQIVSVSYIGMSISYVFGREYLCVDQ